MPKGNSLKNTSNSGSQRFGLYVVFFYVGIPFRVKVRIRAMVKIRVNIRVRDILCVAILDIDEYFQERKSQK